MRGKSFIRIIIFTLWAMAVQPDGMARAQEGRAVDLQIRLRASDGAPVVDESVILQRLPEEEDIAPQCRTDAGGACTWRVPSGLYQLRFDRPLDDVSALAAAEGGLRGLGITVGDAPITYHFTFHDDGRVYFDTAPESIVPVPFIPDLDDLHSAATPATIPTQTVPMTSNASEPPAESTPISAEPTSPTVSFSWRILFFMSLGLVVGGGVHIWTRKRKRPNQPAAKGVRDA